MTILPTFRPRPFLVSGIPMARETLAFAAEIPTARFQKKPPRLICSVLVFFGR